MDYLALWTSFMVILTGCSFVSTEGNFSFGYDGDEGPDYWAEHFETCAGKYQSPINIVEHLVQQVQLAPVQLKGYDALSTTSTLTNNGHTVMLELNTSEVASMSGGPLKGEYIFAQLHFHWGANDTFGSEDLINNRSYPMELHIVSYKSDYGNSSEAGNHEDGLAVMGFFFEVSDTDNEAYSDIVHKVALVTEPGTKARLDKPMTLSSLISNNHHSYFTYHGSLTTPPCSEVVTWLDFTEPLRLSHNQLDVFRSLKSHSGLMTHNNRPTQPLGGRLLWYNQGVQAINGNDYDLTGIKNKQSSAHVHTTYLALLSSLCYLLKTILDV